MLIKVGLYFFYDFYDTINFGKESMEEGRKQRNHMKYMICCLCIDLFPKWPAQLLFFYMHVN